MVTIARGISYWELFFVRDFGFIISFPNVGYRRCWVPTTAADERRPLSLG
jgi:hypothetical protein